MRHILTSILVIITLSAVVFPASAQFTVSVGISIRTAPPPLPVYSQPPCPVDGYLWTPGYWAYDESDGYYWVPGVWVSPPTIGYLWTPGYWGYDGGFYGWHSGYWGPHCGYYGGVNYGYGYGGTGFYGGAWQGRSFRYNTAVLNVNRTVVHNTYIDRTVIINNRNVSRASYNGPGGYNVRPTAAEQVVARENHVQPTRDQFSHNQTAAQDRNQFATVNHGRPAAVAMNTVGGQRFNTQGRSAAPVVQRPAAGIRATPNNSTTRTPAQNNAAQAARTQSRQLQPIGGQSAVPQTRAAPARQLPQQSAANPREQRPDVQARTQQQARTRPQASQQPQVRQQQPQQIRQQPQVRQQQPQQVRQQPQVRQQQPQQVRQQPQVRQQQPQVHQQPQAHQQQPQVRPQQPQVHQQQPQAHPRQDDHHQ